MRAPMNVIKNRSGGDPSAPLDSTKIFIGITGSGTSAETKTVSSP